MRMPETNTRSHGLDVLKALWQCNGKLTLHLTMNIHWRMWHLTLQHINHLQHNKQRSTSHTRLVKSRQQILAVALSDVGFEVAHTLLQPPSLVIL